MPFDDGKGMRLVLVNQTQKMVELFASDSRLDIVQEAQTSTGEWKPIEFLQPSFCGNSFHTAYLPPNHFWQFGTPRYRGEFQTRLRFALSIDRSHTIYSNEFDGSINPEQIRAAEALSAAMMEFEDEDRSWFTVFMEYLKPKPPSPPITLLPEQPKRPSVEVDPLPPSNERE